MSPINLSQTQSRWIGTGHKVVRERNDGDDQVDKFSRQAGEEIKDGL